MHTAFRLWLPVALGLMAGLIWFGWTAHDIAPACTSGVRGHPNGPTIFETALLVAVPGIIVTALHVATTHAWARSLAHGFVAATLAALSITIAVFIWISQYCGH